MLKYLRDPIWQSIGVILALIVTFLTLNIKSDQKSELVIYPYSKIKFEDFRLPSDQVKLVIQGTKEEIKRAVVDYFIIQNTSNKPILAKDFIENITLSPGIKTERIFLVSSCNTSDIKNDNNNEDKTFISLTWQKKGQTWVTFPTLLNPNDKVCVSVISQEINLENNKSSSIDGRLIWNARIINFQIKNYNLYEEYLKNIDRDWKNYFQTNIFLYGFSAYWFVLFQISLLLITLNFSYKANWLNSENNKFKLIFITLMSTALAEVFTDIFVNLNISNLHDVSYFLIIFYVLFLIYLKIKYKKNKTLLILEN